MKSFSRNLSTAVECFLYYFYSPNLDPKYWFLILNIIIIFKKSFCLFLTVFGIRIQMYKVAALVTGLIDWFADAETTSNRVCVCLGLETVGVWATCCRPASTPSRASSSAPSSSGWSGSPPTTSRPSPSSSSSSSLPLPPPAMSGSTAPWTPRGRDYDHHLVFDDQ